ncbi:MAG TPA: hypothetical protein V6C65_34220, partial [Allocoleopsis sp.]
ASAISLFIAKRKNGWGMSSCIAAIDWDTPLRVDVALSPLEQLTDDRLVEIASALMRSALQTSVVESSVNWFEVGKRIGLEDTPRLSSDDLAAIENFFGKTGLSVSDLVDTDKFDWIATKEVEAGVPDDELNQFYLGVFNGILQSKSAIMKR